MSDFWRQMLGVYVLFSLVCGFSALVVTFGDLYTAYGVPDRSLDGYTIKFNDFGEFWIEFFMMLVAIPGMLVGVVQQFNRLDRMGVEYDVRRR